jgi:uncharacterized membrane protein
VIWFWYFLFYSFLGFLLEVIFARVARVNPHRKCLRILPLCPVYGFGGCTIAAAAGEFSSPLAIFFLGIIFATAWEYIMAAFYEDALGAAFWDYSDVPFNIHGRICLPFSVAWGLLSIPLSLWVHPWLEGLRFSPPPFVPLLMALAFGADVLLSCALVIRSGTRESLNW